MSEGMSVMKFALNWRDQSADIRPVEEGEKFRT